MTTTEDRDRLARLEAAYEFVRDNMATKEDVARLEGRMDTMKAEMTGRMDAMESRLLIRFGAGGIMLVGVAIGVLKFWP